MPSIIFSVRLILALSVSVFIASEAAAQSAPCQYCGNSQSPVASPSGPYVASTNQSISFDGSGSWSFDGPIIYYFWDFGDGSYGTGSNPNHQYAAEGAYTVTLTVCDDLWNCASSESYATTGTVNLPARINFDELPNNTIFSDQFQPYFNAYGVRFSTDNPFYPVRTWNDCGFCATTSLPNFIEAGSNNQGQTIVEFAQPVNNLTFYMIGVDAFFNQFAVIDVYRETISVFSYSLRRVLVNR